MLKRLLIAVFALSLVLAFSGTAFSDVYPNSQMDGQRANRNDASNPKASQAETAFELQPASRPLADNVVKMPDGFTVAAPPLQTFCADVDHYAAALTFYWWPAVPGAIDDFFNVRYTSELNFEDTLMIYWQYVASISGTPSMMAYLWDDDGFGFPGTVLDSILIPSSDLTTSWNAIDFKASPNAPAEGWIFSDGAEYHYGFRAIGDPATDTIGFLTDDAGFPTGENRTSFFDDGAGSWGTMLGVFSAEFGMVQSSEYCAGEIFSDCFSLDYINNILWYTWKTPDPTWGNQWYSQKFTMEGAADTLVSIDIFIFNSSDLSFGGSDVVVNILDDDGAGGPGSTVLFTATLLDGSYVPGWNNIALPAGFIITGDYHIAFTSINPTLGDTLADGSPDTYEKFQSDNALAGEGRSYTSYNGTTWIPMVDDWGIDVNFAITANICRDRFAECKRDSHFGNNWFTFSMGNAGYASRSKVGVQMNGAGQLCQVNDVAIVFDDFFSDPHDFIYDTKVSVFTDAGGFPGTELASVILTPADYNAWPAYTTADFSGLGVFIAGDYWAVMEYLVPAGDSSTIGFNSDDGSFDNGARSASFKQPPSSFVGWTKTLDVFGTDFGFDITSALCCQPFDERACLPGTDEGWSTFQGSQTRDGASMLSLGDAWCNLNLNWSYDGPAGVSFTGPVISGDYAVCSFTDRYIVFDIITGAPVYTLDNTLGDGQLLGVSIRCAPAIVNGVMYISGGASNGVGAVDFATGNLIWQRTFFSVGGAGLFGQTRFGVMTVLTDATQAEDILYFSTDGGSVVAVYADDGVLDSAWAVNPVQLSAGTYISGATDGANLFYSTQSSTTNGDIFSIDALTGVINWSLSANGGLQAEIIQNDTIPFGFPEGFFGGVAYNNGVLYACSWANDLGINPHPVDGVFYSIDAGNGNHFLPATKTNRALYSTPIVDQNAVYVPTRSQWANQTDPTGGNLIAFNKSTGTQLWGVATADDGRYFSSGLITCEPGLPDLLFVFNWNGFLECYSTDNGDQLFRRRVEHGGTSGEFGMAGALATTATDGIHMMFADFYGGLYDFKSGADRPRMELQTYNPVVPVEFGVNPALPVNVGPIMTNTGCADLIIASAAVDELPHPNGSVRPNFSAGYVTEDIMERAAAISDFMKRDAFLSKFRQVYENDFDANKDVFNVKSIDSEKSTSRYSAGIPAWFVSLDHPVAGDVIVPGDTMDLQITINQIVPIINRGPQSVYIVWDSNDPDFFLNAAADAAGLLPEIKLTAVGGCLIDTTTLNFGVGSANIQLVTNSGRIGTGDWDPHGFEIDGDNSSYYQGSYIYGTSTFSLALNTQAWAGGGEAESWTSMQADPNFCDSECKPAFSAAVNVGMISTDGITYAPIAADMVCKTYLDSVENFDTNPDPLTTDWDWENYGGRFFDDTLTMGLMANTRTFGVSDLPALANLTFEIMEFTERNGDSVNGWYFGQITDYDVGGDSADWDPSISTVWSMNPGGDAAFGSIKIPFGCGTMLAGQDFDYNNIRGVKGLHGSEALFDVAAYFDSAYIYLSTPGYLPHQDISTSDGEMHSNYAGHDFGPNGTYSIGIANFFVQGLADNNSGAELADMANMVNKWAGFGRGDVNNDGGINLADIIYLAGNVNNGGPGAIPFAHLGDVNADGNVDVDDIAYLVDYYFNCGPCPSGDWMF